MNDKSISPWHPSNRNIEFISGTSIQFPFKDGKDKIIKLIGSIDKMADNLEVKSYEERMNLAAGLMAYAQHLFISTLQNERT
jgi:hypothetical protein